VPSSSEQVKSITDLHNQEKAFALLLLASNAAAAWSVTVAGPAGHGSFPQVAAHRAGISMEAVLDAYGDDRPSASALSRGKTAQHPDVLDLGNVAKILKVDIPNILRKEPTWGVFAPDFQVIDHTGARLEGLRLNKVLLQLLRRARDKFVVQDDIRVNPMVRASDSNAAFAARWKVRLGGVELEEDPVDIEAETFFHLNERNQLDYMRIDKCKSSGYEFRFWPEVKLSDGLLSNLQAIKQWARDINELKTIREPMVPMEILSLSPHILNEDDAAEDAKLLSVANVEQVKEWVGKYGPWLMLFALATFNVLHGAPDISHGSSIPSEGGPDGGFWFKDGMIYFNGEWF